MVCAQNVSHLLFLLFAPSLAAHALLHLPTPSLYLFQRPILWGILIAFSLVLLHFGTPYLYLVFPYLTICLSLRGMWTDTFPLHFSLFCFLPVAFTLSGLYGLVLGDFSWKKKEKKKKKYSEQAAQLVSFVLPFPWCTFFLCKWCTGQREHVDVYLAEVVCFLITSVVSSVSGFAIFWLSVEESWLFCI